ncbi:hypothetical protein COLO4_21045 [Corchorus olitorius]|uniref:Uncharacterized protein n=1 Tax=Corchorus olitorius TaxID=93759 RepID=A0A1R3IVP0_9ROSI|nr:hypothetical protein COLO4_21045 [Corchorus olitorius]
MELRGPGMNRSLNRENPDILIVMIAEKQKMRGCEEDKGNQGEEREREREKERKKQQSKGGPS